MGWIKMSIKKPGSLLRSARRKGMSTKSFAKWALKNSRSGITRRRARLAITLSGLRKIGRSKIKKW